MTQQCLLQVVFIGPREHIPDLYSTDPSAAVGDTMHGDGSTDGLGQQGDAHPPPPAQRPNGTFRADAELLPVSRWAQLEQTRPQRMQYYIGNEIKAYTRMLAYSLLEAGIFTKCSKLADFPPDYWDDGGGDDDAPSRPPAPTKSAGPKACPQAGALIAAAAAASAAAAAGDGGVDSTDGANEEEEAAGSMDEDEEPGSPSGLPAKDAEAGTLTAKDAERSARPAGRSVVGLKALGQRKRARQFLSNSGANPIRTVDCG